MNLQSNWADFRDIVIYNINIRHSDNIDWQRSAKEIVRIIVESCTEEQLNELGCIQFVKFNPFKRVPRQSAFMVTSNPENHEHIVNFLNEKRLSFCNATLNFDLGSEYPHRPHQIPQHADWKAPVNWQRKTNQFSRTSSSVQFTYSHNYGDNSLGESNSTPHKKQKRELSDDDDDDLPVSQLKISPPVTAAAVNNDLVDVVNRLELVTDNLNVRERLDEIIERPLLTPLKLYMNHDITASQMEMAFEEMFKAK